MWGCQTPSSSATETQSEPPAATPTATQAQSRRSTTAPPASTYLAPGTATPTPSPAVPPRPAGVAQAEDKPRATLAYEGSRPRPPQFYDLDSPSYRVLQKASDALAGFPRDADNQTDWMRALGRKLIRPRADLRGKGTMQLLDTNIIMTNTKDMAHVRFPHRSHTEWLACQNCHDEIFVAKRGANRITMNDILLGKYCGVCHDKVAFSSYVCDRCHSVTNPARTK